MSDVSHSQSLPTPEGSPCNHSHQCVLKLLLVICAVHSVGPTLIQVPVVVHISYAQALWGEGGGRGER